MKSNTNTDSAVTYKTLVAQDKIRKLSALREDIEKTIARLSLLKDHARCTVYFSEIVTSISPEAKNNIEKAISELSLFRNDVEKATEQLYTPSKRALLDTKIEDLSGILSRRVIRAIHEENISTIRELTQQMSMRDLIRMRQFGEKSKRELTDFLLSKGLTLREHNK